MPITQVENHFLKAGGIAGSYEVELDASSTRLGRKR